MKYKALIFAIVVCIGLVPAGAEDDLPWWNDRVFYEVFVRSFYDSDGDGVGDLQGLISKLDYLNDGDPAADGDLGVTGLWLMPVAEAASYHGYDVTDYMHIEPDYGTNADFKALVEAAHARGMAVIVDLVANHTSIQHPWFQAALEGDPQYEAWYRFETEPPNQRGPSGQEVWHPVDGGRSYYALFWGGMPDLNYENPEVTEAMHEIARFWLEEMGADGFRLDAVKHLVEDDHTLENAEPTFVWLKDFQSFVKSVDPDALTVGEAWSGSSIAAQYVEREAVDLVFEFSLAEAMLASAGSGSSLAVETFQKKMLRVYPPGQYAAFLTNHDQNRVMHALDGDVDKAKVVAALLLTQPGVPFIYYGEEIGMTGAKPDERIRTPMQWEGTAGTAGFTQGTPWQPPAAGYEAHSVMAQTDDPDSLLSHYRALVHLRSAHPALRVGAHVPVASDARAVYAFLRHTDDETLLVVVNLSDEAAAEYTLSLEAGPLAGETSAQLVFGKGEASAPAVSGAGGFDAYAPLAALEAQSLYVVRLTHRR